MARLLSGSTLRKGGSGEFIDLASAMPQLPATETTLTGFTIATDPLLRTSYRSSLGFIEFKDAKIYSSLPEGIIRVLATGTSFLSTSTATGNLVVQGGIGVGGNMFIAEDINVNGLTIGTGFEGQNNIVVRGTALPVENEWEIGQQSITIGYSSLQGLTTANKSIAIGRNALSSGTKLTNVLAIGDSSLLKLGTIDKKFQGTISNVVSFTESSITSILTIDPITITSPGHGLVSGDQIYITGVEGVTTTTNIGGFLSTSSLVNNQVLYAQYINDDVFSIFYNRTLTTTVNGENASAYQTGGTVVKPVEITVSGTEITTSSRIYIEGLIEPNQLNENFYYVNQLTTTTFSLFTEPSLEIPVNGTGFLPYQTSGTVYRVYSRYGNVAYGNDSGSNLIDGRENLFIGHQAATSLTTGSYNIFIGHNKTPFLYTGSGIISIGGDNIVNGLDDQVSIGSVFYYDGRGYSYISAETSIGLGTESTGTSSGALMVVGGAGIAGNTNIGGHVKVLNTQTSTSTSTGALIVNGGVGINGNVHSLSGNPDENYLLYTPKVHVTNGIVPSNPRIGDFWIDSSVPAYLQYIKDGVNTFWIQIGSV